ncbi:gpp [Drosophila busckii]|uniref:Histone-lysine N-methyltransferase, H3 lysine-79 specific n=1 Tax=Drosophila busckii TaxID=30019 RepID=A0A0M3QX86_DROBS|nr:gpp [Drosophila busckii]
MATPQVKDLVLRSPAGSSDLITFAWPLQVGHGQDKHDNGIDILDTIKFVCDELPSISSAFEEINLNHIDTACYKTMTNLVDRFNKAVDSIVALEKGTSLPAERLNKFAHPSLLRHILQLVYNAAVLDPDKLNQYEPFSPEVYGETSYELVQQMLKHVTVSKEDTFIDLGSGVGQVVLQMAGSFPLKTCIGIEKADTPARYAERMDLYFRQYMGWFGKRYCEYKLIKGDFLVDEHREKITSSTLVFVNNFAFGPTVDHQLKERFADLRDGARVVSSKSFCPLNFRITDRNLSDIGTIMHVSEIPPLKGSVSWTCKPVSYYLHVIDRTILERYFQRLKTKGGDHEHSAAASKTRQQAQASAQQQQRSLDMETSTESDGDGETTHGNGHSHSHSGGNTTTATNTTSSNGPTTRKVWSDWCSSKDKSSQSDDEENNNSNSNSNQASRLPRAAALQKKRKKLTRKAAIASKSAAAAAAQREAEAEAEASTHANSKDSSSKEDQPRAASAGPGRKGRLKKGQRGRKCLKIVGLDVLHKQTVLSTSLDSMAKKLPAAPGTVDQQLTSLLTGDMSHRELDIPTAPQDTPYALQILLDVFRAQYMTMIDHMRSSAYLPQVQKQIAQEQERMVRLKNRANQLDKQIKVLIDDSVTLLKVRMNELGINVNSPNDLIAQAKEIVGRHKDLQHAVSKMRNEVTVYENEQKLLLSKHMKHLPEYQKLCGASNMANGKIKLELPQELSETAAQELVLKEIANTLSQRKKLVAQVSTIEQETSSLQKSADERSTAAALLAQGTNISVANTAIAAAPPNPAPAAVQQACNKLSAVKSTSRRSREHRARSQEWPEVPEVGKIQESNPEVLAQKILETCRQVEAGKFQAPPVCNAISYAVNGKQAKLEPKPELKSPLIYKDSTLMPAPKQQQQQQQLLPKCELPLGLSRSKQESPKVANFEDRLKSIITSALNEDQEQRSKALPAVEVNAAPVNKRSKPSSANNFNNIITVSTQGLMHLNANTTISPVTPPLPGPRAATAASTAPPPPANLPYGSAYMSSKPQPQHKYNQTSLIKESKYAPPPPRAASAAPPAPPPPPPPPATSAASAHMATLYGSAAAAATPADLGYHRRRASVSTNSYEHFMAQQQQQQQALMMAHMTQQRLQQQQQQQQHAHQQHAQLPHHHAHHHQQQQQHHQEFKAPAEQLLQRSSSREQLVEQQQPLELLPRASSANSDYPGYRVERLSVRPPSRPSSNCSQPDYTQVSPAKMALRRHLSQEKLNQPPQALATPPPLPTTAGKTIGDLVNGEIERTLEISHQSIINAAVNMSTGSGAGSSGSNSGGAHYLDRAFPAERLLINLNAQRPERVHVRPLNEEASAQSAQAQPTNYSQTPTENSLATLAHVAYAQKSQPGANNKHAARSGRDYQPVALPRAEMKGCIEAYFHEEHSKSKSGSSSNVLRTPRLNGANPPLEGLAASLQDHVRARKYKEENEERQRRAAAAAAATSSASSTTLELTPLSSSSAAAAAATSSASSTTLELTPVPAQAPHYAHQAPPAHSYHHHQQQQQQQHAAHLNGTPHKVELGIKRSSPLASHQQPTRPAKLPHFEQQQPLAHAHSHSAAAHQHGAALYVNGAQALPPPAHDATTPSPTPSSSSSSCGRRSKLLVEPPLLMSPEINSLMGDERPLQLSASHHHHHQQQQQQQHHHHHSHQQQQQHVQQQQQQQHSLRATHQSSHSHSITPTMRSHAPDDDDVITADDESHWQHRVSSGFDRLVAFASTELDKTRRSIDGDTVPASISCNTSPDSGITHSSSNSDAARTFLSTSSSSSQLDLPINNSNSSSSSNSLYASQVHNLSHHHAQQQQPQQQQQQQQKQQQQHLDHLSDSSMKSSASSSMHASSSLKTVSPVDSGAIDSPPLSEMGLPRTPSPNTASVATPPLAHAPSMDNELRIPLKYQRKSKSGSEKHYKKKFCERNWEYDCDELLAYSNLSAPPTAADAAGNGPTMAMDTPVVAAAAAAAPLAAVKSGKSPKDKASPHHSAQAQAGANASYNHHHKSSKFRPKGKDWDWSLDTRSNAEEPMPNGNASAATTSSN